MCETSPLSAATRRAVCPDDVMNPHQTNAPRVCGHVVSSDVQMLTSMAFEGYFEGPFEKLAGRGGALRNTADIGSALSPPVGVTEVSGRRKTWRRDGGWS